MEKIKRFLLINTNTNQIIIKNTFWLFVGEMGVRLLKLIIFIYAARKLGVSEWGLFSYSIALMSIFAIVSDIGINAVLIKNTVKDNRDKYISTSFFLKIILSFIAGLILFSWTLFIDNNDILKTIISIMSLVLFFDSLREFGFTLNRAFEKMEIEAITKIITTIFLVIAGLIFISHKNTALSLTYSYLLSGIIGVMIMYFTSRKHLKNFIIHIDTKLLLPIFKEAWPLAIVGIFGIITTNIDIMILNWYKGPFDVGIYSVAQKPIQLIYIIPSLFSIALLPVLSKLSLENKNRMNHIVNKSINLSLMFAFPVVIIGILFGEPLLLFMFGQQYFQSIIIFKIMIIAIIISSPGIILSNLIFVENRQRKLAEAVAIGTISNILLCILLIPRLGIYGAAISTVICQIISNFFIIKNAVKIPSIKIKLDLKKIITASFIMTLLILILINKVNIIILMIISVIFYLFILFFLKDKNLLSIYNIVNIKD